MRRVWVLIGIAIALALSCGHNPLKSRKVCLIAQSLADPFHAKLAEGTQQAAAELNLDLAIRDIEKPTHVERQITLVENETIKRVGAILISPADSAALVGPLKEAMDRGIVVIAMDNPPDPKVMQAKKVTIPFIGPDDSETGKTAARFLIGKLGGKGKVALLKGLPGVLSRETAEAGFLDACKEAGVEVVTAPAGGWERKDASAAVSKMLGETPDLRGLFAVSGAVALGAADAVKAKSKSGEVLVVGCGNGKDIREAILSGTMAAAIDRHPEEIARQAVRLAAKALDGAAPPASTQTPISLTDANVLKNTSHSTEKGSQ